MNGPLTYQSGIQITDMCPIVEYGPLFKDDLNNRLKVPNPDSGLKVHYSDHGHDVIRNSSILELKVVSTILFSVKNDHISIVEFVSKQQSFLLPMS